MYRLEIETKNTLKKVENPRKARFLDMIFFDTLQVMDDNGIWITVKTFVLCTFSCSKKQIIVDKINYAIRHKKPSVYLDV